MAEFDYIIVGSGSAGSVLANRLTESGKHTVLVLEAGPADWHPFIHIPAGFIKTFHNPRLNWLYKMEPTRWTNGREILAPRGKTLGGSSSINGLIYNRGQRMDFDHWSQLGNRGWGFDDVLPHFRRMEQRLAQNPADTDNDYRGTDGPLTVSDIDWHHPLCEAFIEGAVQHGIPRNPDYNGSSQEGVAYAQRTIRNGRRVSASRAFLNPAKRRPNLAIQTNAHVTSITFDGKRATGVTYRIGGKRGSDRSASARGEIILSGGVFNSPQLLMLSGIGPPEHLAEHGIEVRHGLAGVGENLRDHYGARLVARVKNIDTINERARGLKLAGEIANWMFRRKGILGLSPTLVYAFWHSNEITRNADIQLTFTPASYREGVQGELETTPGMTTAVWQQRPESKGHVRLKSKDPFVAPLINPNYLGHEDDRKVLLAGMKLARRLLKSKPLEPYYDCEDFPGPAAQSDEDLIDAARQRGTTTFHPMGTCCMAPSHNQNAVVSDELRVHGLQNLRVIDASIMPTMPSANINAATLMIADKAADMILGTN